MIFPEVPTPPDALRARVQAAYRTEETATVEALAEAATLPEDGRARIAQRARALVEGVRRGRRTTGLDAFLGAYDLGSQEGVLLMCLAEALLRIPDAETANRLIRDKIAPADWERHLGQSESLLVNASTWGLMLTGRVVRLDPGHTRDLGGMLGSLVARSGEPIIRQAMLQAMRLLGRQFVMGRTIAEALERAAEDARQGYRHSFDMLGEAARTAADAERYFAAYQRAIQAIGGEAAGDGGDVIARPSISVKLSALHPRYEFAQSARVRRELVPRAAELARFARDAGIGLTIDAEEAERLEPSMEVFAALATDPSLRGWDGLGLAVQAYQKRALPLLDWLADLAGKSRRRLPLRLVKGAYWDSEIKRSQELGLPGYPVFTRKASTDVSYLACARRLMAEPKHFFPQFATHNAHTVAAIIELCGGQAAFEFQRLHGMGEALYAQIVGAGDGRHPCRIYAPVGTHEELLAYLVRRLLENGANTSFVNRIIDESLPVEEIIADPVAQVRALAAKPHPRIPLPRDLFGRERRNSNGIDLSDPAVTGRLATAIQAAAANPWEARPLVGGAPYPGPVVARLDPGDRRREIGLAVDADGAAVDRALALAVRAAPAWDDLGGEARAQILERAADLLESHAAPIMARCVREAGKTLPDAVSELREAVDYCRYYAAAARRDFAATALPGPTGEANRIRLAGQGVFAAISPWNFPLAIFMGQLAAALAAGNAVVAKPAEQTPLTAALAVGLLHRAGSLPMSCTSCRGLERQWARDWSQIRASRASSSPGRPRPHGPSTGRWRRATGRSCR